jgi:hypothetical protein
VLFRLAGYAVAVNSARDGIVPIGEYPGWAGDGGCSSWQSDALDAHCRPAHRPDSRLKEWFAWAFGDDLLVRCRGLLRPVSGWQQFAPRHLHWHRRSGRGLIRRANRSVRGSRDDWLGLPSSGRRRLVGLDRDGLLENRLSCPPPRLKHRWQPRLNFRRLAETSRKQVGKMVAHAVAISR